MVLPLGILRACQKQSVLVELKNGETYTGLLGNCDPWMNLHITDAVCTSRDGSRFWRLPECFIRGNTVKFFRLAEEAVELAKEQANQSSTVRHTSVRAKGGKGKGKGKGKGDVQGVR